MLGSIQDFRAFEADYERSAARLLDIVVSLLWWSVASGEFRPHARKRADAESSEICSASLKG